MAALRISGDRGMGVDWSSPRRGNEAGAAKVGLE